MGQTQSVGTSHSRNVSMSSESGLIPVGRAKHAKEHKRHGIVTLKMVGANPVRRGAEAIVTHTITPKGCILYGSQNFNPAVVQNAIAGSGYPLVPPTSIPLVDPRAHKVLVTYCKGWHIIPFPEVFSRHSGTCLILGDRTITSPPFQIKVGDCFRLGSVGLVVSEMRADGEADQRIDAKTLEFLKDEALAFDNSGDMATLAADEEKYGLNGGFSSVADGEYEYGDGEGGDDGEGGGGRDDCNTPVRASSVDSCGTTGYLESPECKPCAPNSNKGKNKGTTPNCSSALGSGGITPGERFVCYMCYENHDTEEDALVAPCDCKGDTRYLHVQCLQKWYQASITGVQTQVIRTTGNGAPACKICGSAYKTAFRRADGRKASLLETESNGPYLSLVVVTKHDTNPGLFNTKFRLNFHSHLDTSPFGDHLEDNIITIGRSSSCNMILDYRTVSTIHARITYEEGKFYLTDRRSSNGTMVYLQDPFPLPYQHSLKLRMGRTNLSLQAKRNWTSSLRNMFGPPIPLSELSSPTPDDIQSILASCTSPGDDEMARTIKEDTLTNEDEQQQRQEQQESPGRTFSIRTVPNLNASLEQDSDIDWAGAHLQAGMQTGSESAAMSSGYNQFAHPPARQHLLSEEMSARTLNSAGNSSFHSANSSVTGLTSVPAHVLASNTAINREGISARSRQPIDYSRWEIDYRPRDSASPSPSPQRVYPAPDDFLSEEDRQLEADMRRAIELSLSESQRSRPTAVPAITAAVPAPATTATAEIAVTEQAPASPLVAPLQREGSFQKQRPPAPSSLVRALSERSDTADATRHSQSATAIGAAAGAVTPATAAAVMVEVNAKVSADYVSGGAGGSANLSRPHSAVGNGAADGDNGITQHTRMIGTPERNRATRSQMSSNNSTVGTSLGGTANLVGAGSIVMHDSLSDAQVLQVEQVSETSERVPSAGRQTAQELSTTMPAAGAFTTYGNRKSSTNLQQQHLLQEDIVSSAKDKVFEKENRTDGLGSKKGDSPHSMMRNSTTIDLETAPEAAYLTHQQHH